MTTAARIAKVNALLEGTSVSPIRVPKKAVKPVMVDNRSATMATLAPSTGQMRRINRLHERIGLRTYGPRQFATVFPTMLDASKYYNEAKLAA